MTWEFCPVALLPRRSCAIGRQPACLEIRLPSRRGRTVRRDAMNQRSSSNMPMFRRIQISLFAATAMIAGLATPALAQSGCELKIGSIGPMSGGAAQWGLAMDGAARLAASEVNADTGLKVGDKRCPVTVV